MKSLEFPQFQSPEQVRDMLQKRLDQTATRMRQVICANAKLIITDAKIQKIRKQVHPGDIQFDKNHCQNDRRNGSKYCSVCSDKWAKEQGKHGIRD